MAILKCKMCGGTLEIIDNSSITECEYCGTKQTIPTLDDEKKLNLFSRANRLRLVCEFDKAASVYESIVADFPEEAEAYWGLVLCKYGIEYVDDPATGKKIPTCHRSSFESVFEDENFEMVMETAAPVSVPVYREEAKAIEEIRQGIIEVSSKEEPYDIFICYKESDENGDRTIDSLIAQEIYDALIDEGYRVFFSRITLEDKLGTAYEPYIFAALNSARIMIAVGTSYMNYNAVWVKNEWSRFIQLLGKGEKKVLIPCYKNIDAYDIPKEFKHLQAQDMGKVGALNDLLRGIKKILPKSATISPDSGVSSYSVSSLLDRGYLFLEDEEWDKADAIFERVLDLEPRNPNAYLGKMLIQSGCKNLEELLQSPIVISTLRDYKSYVRFSDDEIIQKVKEHDIIKKEYDEKYQNAVSKLSEYTKTEELAEAISVLESLGDYNNSSSTANKWKAVLFSKRKAEAQRKYDEAMEHMKARSIQRTLEAREFFAELGGFSDAEAKLIECDNLIAELKKESEISECIAKQVELEMQIAALKKVKIFNANYKSAKSEIKIKQEEISALNKQIEELSGNTVPISARGWTCSQCGRYNPNYVGTCGCGNTK